MKRLLLGAVFALISISLHGRIGIKEAEAIAENIKEHDPGAIGKYLLAKLDIITLAAFCKYNSGAGVKNSSEGLKNTDCARLSTFMFNTLNTHSKLSSDVYKNIENSMIEIIEQKGKEASAEEIKHTHSISVDAKNFITSSLIPSIMKK